MLNIVVLSYKWLTSLIAELKFNIPDQIRLRIIDVDVDNVLRVAKSLEENNEVDIFVSSGGNARRVEDYIKKPLVKINVTGFDFLRELSKAMKTKGDIAFVTYKDTIPEFKNISGTLRPNIYYATYEEVHDLEERLEEIYRKGIRKVIGSSLVLDRAQKLGMKGYFIYSKENIVQTVDTAIRLALTKKAEIERTNTLHAMLNYSYCGIIAIDNNGIVKEFNAGAEKILGIPRSRIIGCNAQKVLPGLRTDEILGSHEPDLNQVKTVNNIKILTNNVPVTFDKNVSGAVIAFQDTGMIHEGERAIREKLYQKGFVAKVKFSDILGESQIILNTKKKAALYAKSKSTILLRGESGTGKEYFAQAIHNESSRKNEPFVAINCASLPSQLLQSELFGYEAGSFTGAKKGGKPGLFELADKGTIFLDEIGEISKPMQALLLRVLETHEIIRVGGQKIFFTDIRVIAATNKDLWELVKAGEFREDLYYRLCVLEIIIPPLRERKEDIPFLINAFLKEFRSDLSEEFRQLISKDPNWLCSNWRGNIRELRNIVERFSVLYNGQEEGRSYSHIIKSLLKEANQGDAVSIPCIKEKADIERVSGIDKEETEPLLRALHEAGGKKTEAARLLGMSRTTFWRKMKQLKQ